MLRKVVVMQVLYLAMTTCAQAGQFYLGPSIGYNALTGDAGRQCDDALAYGLFAGYLLDASTAVEINAFYSAHDDVVDDQGSSTMDIWSFLIGPKFFFPWRGTFLTAEVGLGFYPLDYRFEPEGTNLPARQDDDTESGVYAGVGIDVPLGQAIVLGFAFKYHHLFSDNILDGDMFSTQLRLGYKH